MPVTANERKEVMRLIQDPPKRLTQTPGEIRYDIECGNGFKVLRLARRVCTLHGAWAESLSVRNRKLLDDRLIQAYTAVHALKVCHENSLEIGCNVNRVEALQTKIADKLAMMQND